jgi:hypothetical protein
VETLRVLEIRKQQTSEEIEILRLLVRSIAYRLDQLKVGINTNLRTYRELREQYVLLTQALADAILERHGFTFQDLPLHVYLGDHDTLVRLAGDARYARYVPT